MSKSTIVSAEGICICLAGARTFACGREGSAKRTDGSKVDAPAGISTGWNGKTAYPKNGCYALDLGSAACG